MLAAGYGRYGGQRRGTIVRILFVEDSKPIRRENEPALLRAGYEVVYALDGESALRFAQELKPDLILLDLIRPQMSGPEVLKESKSKAATAEIPVVVLSSRSEKNRQKLLQAGAEKYAEKYLEKNARMPTKGRNLLPQALENVICRITEKARDRVFDSPLARIKCRFTGSVPGALRRRDWRRPGAAIRTGMPRPSCSPRARTDRRLPGN